MISIILRWSIRRTVNIDKNMRYMAIQHWGMHKWERWGDKSRTKNNWMMGMDITKIDKLNIIIISIMLIANTMMMSMSMRIVDNRATMIIAMTYTIWSMRFSIESCRTGCIR